MRKIRFLKCPNNYNLYLDEIIDYADSYTNIPIEDLGLIIDTVVVDCNNSADAVRIASKKLFDKNKGFNFVIIGVTW